MTKNEQMPVLRSELSERTRQGNSPLWLGLVRNQHMTWDRTLPAFGPKWPDLHSFYCDTCGHAETLAFLVQPTARHSIAGVAGAKN